MLNADNYQASSSLISSAKSFSSPNTTFAPPPPPPPRPPHHQQQQQPPMIMMQPDANPLFLFPDIYHHDPFSLAAPNPILTTSEQQLHPQLLHPTALAMDPFNPQLHYTDGAVSLPAYLLQCTHPPSLPISDRVFGLYHEESESFTNDTYDLLQLEQQNILLNHNSVSNSMAVHGARSFLHNLVDVEHNPTYTALSSRLLPTYPPPSFDEDVRHDQLGFEYSFSPPSSPITYPSLHAIKTGAGCSALNTAENSRKKMSSPALLSNANNKIELPPKTVPARVAPKRSRKSQHKTVIQVPATGGIEKPTGECLPSDSWAWRKYGQKPIKGSPYPRSYYRCSSFKGCTARKQVERNPNDPGMFVITYTSEHNHGVNSSNPTADNNRGKENPESAGDHCNVKTSRKSSNKNDYDNQSGTSGQFSGEGYRRSNNMAAASSPTTTIEQVEMEDEDGINTVGTPASDDTIGSNEEYEGDHAIRSVGSYELDAGWEEGSMISSGGGQDSLDVNGEDFNCLFAQLEELPDVANCFAGYDHHGRQLYADGMADSVASANDPFNLFDWPPPQHFGAPSGLPRSKHL